MTALNKRLVATYLALLAFLTLVLTNGRLGTLFAHDAFGTRLYANMWQHLMAGDFWVDVPYCTSECFLVGNMLVTSYFGFLPAFLRGFAGLFASPYLLNLAKLSMLLAMSLAFLSVTRAFRRLGLFDGKNRRLAWLFLVAIFVASPFMYVYAWDWIYHEPIAWGLSLSLIFASTYLLWVFDRRERTRRNGLILGAAVGAAIMCRPTIGVMLAVPYVYLLAMAYVQHRRDPNAGHGRAVAAGLGICCLLGLFTMTVNFSRWGNPFTFADMTRHIALLSDPYSRSIYVDNGELNPSRLATSFAYYFLPSPDNFSTHWPFVIADRRLSWLPSFRTYGYVEITRVPHLLGGAVFIFFSCLALRRWRRGSKEENRYVMALLLGSLMTAYVLLVYFALAMRYGVELMPPLFFLGMVFLVGQQRSGQAYRLRPWHYALFIACFFVVFMNTMSYKNYIWEMPPDVRRFIGATMLPPGAGDQHKKFLVGGR